MVNCKLKPKSICIKSVFVFFMLFPFSIQAQFRGGSGGGATKAEIRKQTILSVEDKREADFFSKINIITQSNIFQIQWNEDINIRQIEIVDILGKRIGNVPISESEREVTIPFNKTKGVYFIRFKNDKEQFFTKKVAY